MRQLVRLQVPLRYERLTAVPALVGPLPRLQVTLHLHVFANASSGSPSP